MTTSKHLKIGVLRNVFAQPLGRKVIQDYNLCQLVVFLHCWRWSVLINIGHDHWLYNLLGQIHAAGREVAVEMYFEQCGQSQTPGRTFEQEARRAYWRTVLRTIVPVVTAPLVCKVRGHRIEIEETGEYGRHVISWCNRCNKSLGDGWF